MGEGQPADNLSRADLEAVAAETLRRGRSYKADLLLYRLGGEEIVLKDYSRKGTLWRETLGVLCTGLEARALRALKGVPGVPEFRGRPDRYSVAMSYVAGRRASGSDPELQGNEGFVRELERTVKLMHGRGVVHLDLKHRTNLLVTSDGRPVVLDFESALCADPSGLVGRLLVRLLGQFDWIAVQNWKRRLCPSALSRADLRKAELARKLGRWWLPRRLIDLMVGALSRREASEGRPDPGEGRGPNDAASA